MSESSRHDDLVQQDSKAAPVPNPFAHSANVTISVPETVEIRLVDASVLADYEVWSLAASVLSSAVVGFAVAYIQAVPPQKPIYLATGIVFGLLLLLSGGMALAKRFKLTRRTRRFQFKVGDPIEDGSGK